MIEWSYNNSIQIIETDLPFKVGTGEIDEMCIDFCEQTKEYILNRYGVVRLLDTITKQYPELDICHTRNELLKTENRREHVYKTQSTRYDSRAQDTRSNSHKSRNFNHQNARNFNSSNNRYATNHRRNFASPENSYYHYPETQETYIERKSHPVNGGVLPRANFPLHRSSAGSSSRDRYAVDSAHYSNKRGCYNCGEYNHRQNTCRFDHRIRCGYCGTLGHKSKMCFATNI